MLFNDGIEKGSRVVMYGEGGGTGPASGVPRTRERLKKAEVTLTGKVWTRTGRQGVDETWQAGSLLGAMSLVGEEADTERKAIA